jgi:3-hydroxyisobutyrate dehydrogenase-like beta-hydroxyacid dehydrogenase
VSVIGLGPMGLPIARNLHAAGHAVTAWNRSSAPADRFAADGGRAVSTLSRLAGDIVLSALPDVDQLEPMLATLAARPGRTVVVMSTSSPTRMTDLAERWRGRLEFADAPMSGGVTGAAAASLSIMVGADDQVFVRIQPVLSSVGRTIEHVGPLGTGMLAKLCNQVVVAGTLASLAEAMVLAEAGGVDLAVLKRLLEGGLADSAVLRAKAATMIERDYKGGGSTRNQVKDLQYVVEAARAHGSPSPMATAALALFEAGVSAGLGDVDHSVVKEVLERRRGEQ